MAQGIISVRAGTPVEEAGSVFCDSCAGMAIHWLAQLITALLLKSAICSPIENNLKYIYIKKKTKQLYYNWQIWVFSILFP